MAQYEIQFGSGMGIYPFTELIEADNEQEAVDNLIDKLEADESIVVTLDEIDRDGYHDDEYIIGGNHGLALLHYGQFYIFERKTRQ